MASAPPQGELLPLYPQLSPQNFRFVKIANIKPTVPSKDELHPQYPQLSPQNFRFVKIANIKQFHEKEVDSNHALYKKYKKLIKKYKKLKKKYKNIKYKMLKQIN
jgi:Fe-S-cluster formation regulator IscX/YfhJ